MGQKRPNQQCQALKEEKSYDQASIPLGPLHCADNNTTYIQYEKNTEYTQNNHN